MARYIYGYPRSPYLPLLAHAGAELGDLQTMVRQRGLEGTLEQLRDDGVYFSFEEFKGRMEVARGGRTHRFSERDFDNPFQGPTLEIFEYSLRMDHPSVAVNFDPANMILYDKGDPIEAVRTLSPWIRHLHVKDALRTTTPGPCLLSM